MFEPTNSMKEDAKRDGMVSQIIKRLGALELFMRTHLAVQHYIATSFAFPKTAVMWHDQSIATVGGAIASSHDTNMNYAFYASQGGAANGDTFTNGFFIAAGTYSLNYLALTNAGQGKIDYYIDNVLVSSGTDHYSAALTYNALKTIAGIVIATDGYHVLKGVVNGKNGASAGYSIAISKFWFLPAAY